MAKIYAPNKQYTGVSAGVPFAGGVAECEDPARLSWFKDHNYQVEDAPKAEKPPKPPKKPKDKPDEKLEEKADGSNLE